MNKTILLVEDEVKLRTNIKVFLEMNGYQTVEAGNGEEGLRAVRKSAPDLIITDIMMPKMDGYSLLRELKCDDQLKKIPVIVLTAKEGLRDLCTIEGAVEFLAKPFELNAILEIIKKNCNRPSPLVDLDPKDSKENAE
ncbi:MAG: response regulator [Candidatus Omnitrophica bacterium]|nr:response regulator [Candidatus Omnitrophota bacterium]